VDVFFTDAQRALQQANDSIDLANRLLEVTVATELAEAQAQFVASQSMFFLATVDEFGFPSCSYKGGHRGFVRVLNPSTLIFPNFDGNGMFMSLGNIKDRQKVGLLFIDFEKPQRLRVRGDAEVIESGALVDSYPGAQQVVRVTVSNVWVNCPRYIPKMTLEAASPAIPNADGDFPLALWKRIDFLQDVLTDDDRARASMEGLITIETYEVLLSES
jgi:predicted pyridoxine 5'-phosphate oxidase superfamily flavin-nucleotide-binding protein